jgi:hypothetical protein
MRNGGVTRGRSGRVGSVSSRGVAWGRSARGAQRRLACTTCTPLARWVDWLTGPGDGTMNSIYIYTNVPKRPSRITPNQPSPTAPDPSPSKPHQPTHLGFPAPHKSSCPHDCGGTTVAVVTLVASPPQRSSGGEYTHAAPPPQRSSTTPPRNHHRGTRSHHHTVPPPLWSSDGALEIVVPNQCHHTPREPLSSNASTSTPLLEPSRSFFFSTLSSPLRSSSSSSICFVPPSSTSIRSTQSSPSVPSSDPTSHHAPKHPPRPHSIQCRAHH